VQHFARTRVVLSDALVDLEGVGELVTRWNASHPDTASGRRVVLSVDAVSFRRVLPSRMRDQSRDSKRFASSKVPSSSNSICSVQKHLWHF
jgi:hypothetical protein